MSVISNIYNTLGNYGTSAPRRLANGWIVTYFLRDYSTMGVYVSKDRGDTWQLFATAAGGRAYNMSNVFTGGNYVYIVTNQKCYPIYAPTWVFGTAPTSYYTVPIKGSYAGGGLCENNCPVPGTDYTYVASMDGYSDSSADYQWTTASILKLSPSGYTLIYNYEQDSSWSTVMFYNKGLAYTNGLLCLVCSKGVVRFLNDIQISNGTSRADMLYSGTVQGLYAYNGKFYYPYMGSTSVGVYESTDCIAWSTVQILDRMYDPTVFSNVAIAPDGAIVSTQRGYYKNAAYIDYSTLTGITGQRDVVFEPMATDGYLGYTYVSGGVAYFGKFNYWSPPTIQANVGGVYKSNNMDYVNVNGVQKQVDSVWENVGGIWKKS